MNNYNHFQLYLSYFSLLYLSFYVILRIIFSFWVYRTTKDKELVWVLWFIDIKLTRRSEYSERKTLNKLTQSQINFYRMIEKQGIYLLWIVAITLIFKFF